MAEEQPSASTKHPTHAVRTVILVVVFSITVLAAFAFAIAFWQTPHVHYNLAKFDCSKSAIAGRNRVYGTPNEDGCLIQIAATNLSNKTAKLDYDGIGGGPAGSGTPSIRIYDSAGRFCYASGGLIYLPAQSGTLLSLSCEDNSNIDTHPAYVTISYGFSHVRVNLDASNKGA